MKKLVTILLMIARLLGVLQIVLGLAIWFGFAAIIAVHAIIGSLFVLAGWVIALIALFALPKRALPLFVLLFGGAVMWFGVAQATLLPGSAHWAIRLVHLLSGLAMLGLIESLGKAVRLHESVPRADGDSRIQDL